MLRIKTSDSNQPRCYVNFHSSVSEKCEKHVWTYTDPLTRDLMEIDSFMDDPKTLDAQSAIALLQELRWHLQWILPKEKPLPYDLRLGCAWKERCMQTESLIADVQKQLQQLLWETIRTNYPYDDGHEVEYPSLSLFSPEDHLLFWYAYDYFAPDMDLETLNQVRAEVEYQMVDLLDQLDEMPNDSEDADASKVYQLCEFRSEEKQRQMDQLDAMELEKSPSRRPKELRHTQVFSDESQLPISVDMDAEPQWFSITELIDQIEKIKLYHREEILLEDPLKSKLEARNEALLQELNCRMMSILAHCEGCHTPLDQLLAPVAPQGRIRFVPAFLEGSSLKRPEDLIACWYLNECFPYEMSEEQIQQVREKLCKMQNTLEEMWDPHRHDIESDLLIVRCKLKEQQLEEVTEERCTPNWPFED